MSAAVTALSSLTRASPRNCCRQCSSACSLSAFAQAPTLAFEGLPVGRTIRKLSMKASSIGPCKPCRLRSLPSSTRSTTAQSPPGGLRRCSVQERSESTGATGSNLSFSRLAVDEYCGGRRGVEGARPRRQCQCQAGDILRRHLDTARKKGRIDRGPLPVFLQTVERSQSIRCSAASRW